MKANTWLVPVLVLGFWVNPARAMIIVSQSCGMNLSVAPLNDQLLAAFQSSELNRKTLAVAERLMIDRFTQTLLSAPIDPDKVSQLLGLEANALRAFNIAVNMHMHGLEMDAREYAGQMIRTLGPICTQPWSIDKLMMYIQNTAEDYRIYPSFAMAQQIRSNQPSLESIFLTISERFFGIPISPRAMEAVRSVIQYAQTAPDDRILEIGFGSPSAMIALNVMIGKPIVGIDLDPTWQKINPLIQPHIDMIQGHFPNDAIAMQKVRAKAPYRAIYALDYYWNSGSAADLPVIYDLLDEGGVFIVLNDFMKPPRFTQAEAEKVGFKTFTFGASRPMTLEWLKILPYASTEVRPGQLALFVFRKGEPSLERVHMEPKSK